MIFWAILIIFVEWRFPFCDCSQFGRIYKEEEEEFFKNQLPDINEEESEVMDKSESSEIA